MRKFLLLSSAAVALAVVAASLASNAGVCFREMRHLDEAEYYRSAVDVVIHDPIDGVTEDHLPDRTVAKAVHSQKLTSDEFLSEFPNCCKFVSPNSGDGDGLDIGVLDELLGVHVVEVTYLKKYFDEGRQKTSKVVAKVAVTCCGKGLPFR